MVHEHSHFMFLGQDKQSAQSLDSEQDVRNRRIGAVIDNHLVMTGYQR
jgi:hypothetical protein